MVAAGLGGYIGWLLWGTGLQTQAAQNDLRQGFEHVVNSKPTSEAPQPGSAALPLRGQAYAEIVIPRLDFDMIVVQGTDEESLKKGPGHYPDTATLGTQPGAWASRATAPRTCIRSTTWINCRSATRSRSGPNTAHSLTRCRGCSSCLDGLGCGAHADAKPTLVLTTCNPRYSSSQRLIVTADRVD